MEEITHKGYRIIAESYKDDETGKWVPRVLITYLDETPNLEMPMSWEREFATQLQADDFALDGAQLYIDNHF